MKSTKERSTATKLYQNVFKLEPTISKKADLNGCEASDHLQGRSYATSMNETTPVVTYPIHRVI